VLCPSVGSSGIVTVCHIRDPSDFYVQRVADAGALLNLCKQLCKHVHTYRTPPEAVLKGKYIAAVLVTHSRFQTVFDSHVLHHHSNQPHAAEFLLRIL
jgi:hypothetical protein